MPGGDGPGRHPEPTPASARSISTPADAQRAADAREWLVKAREDLRAAAILARVDAPLLGPALYHCQQAAEKAFKGFLYWCEIPFRKTHDLEQLGDACARLDLSLRTVVDAVADMTAFAWEHRYPGDVDEPAPADLREALTQAQAVVDAVAERLPHAALTNPDAS
jgi:HEPN domain-containing protein